MYMSIIRYGFKHLAGTVTLLFGLLCFAGGGLAAQTTTGVIRGTVTGQAGEAIGSAQIVARNVSTGATRNALSNDAGAYALVGLTPGTYNVTVRRIGSAPQTRTIVVQIGATQVQDLTLAAQAAVLLTQVVTASSGGDARAA